MRIPKPRSAAALALAGTCLLAALPAGRALAADSERTLRRAIETRTAANESGAETQKRINDLSEETDAFYARYQNASAQLASLRKFNQGMRDVIAEQDKQIAGLTGELDQVDEVARSVTPLMFQMIDALDSFISLDTPFLAEERAERVEDLRGLMVRADVTVSEKYRRIMEAYQIENEYGRTIEAYRGPKGEGGETVDFLRFGRVALVYLSLDQNEAGAWDPRERSWKPLDEAARDDVLYGLRIARKQLPPDLITLPLPEAVVAGGEG